ncbi:MAG TPA: hypothetical protein VFI33_01090 [Puia sp.]|nr:hypothetical protein [Puia sp.]
MTISITKLYDILTAKLGREAAENLTSYIEEKIRDEVNNKSELLATKVDLANTKAEIIKWVFIFWLGQIGVTFGFMSYFLKK